MQTSRGAVEESCYPCCYTESRPTTAEGGGPMPQKQAFPPLPTLAPARVPAAHVQEAFVKAAQAKLPEAPVAARPVAPHVQNALAWSAQAKSDQRTAGTWPAPKPANAKFAIQRARRGRGAAAGGGAAAAAAPAAGLDFAGMRAFLQKIKAAAPNGRGGRPDYSVDADARLTREHDELLGAGQHHRDRGLTLRQLKEDIEAKLLEHKEPTE